MHASTARQPQHKKLQHKSSICQPVTLENWLLFISSVYQPLTLENQLLTIKCEATCALDLSGSGNSSSSSPSKTISQTLFETTQVLKKTTFEHKNSINPKVKARPKLENQNF